MDNLYCTQPGQTRIVALLSEESHVPPDEVATLYERERALLAVGSHVPNFLHVFAIRNVREMPWTGGSAGPSAAIRMFCVGAVDIVVYKIIKRWIARERPCHACAAIRACVPSLDEFSFPSGHTLHSVACSVILTADYPAAAYFVWPFTVLVGISRVVLGLHYPSDVLVVALIGATTAVVSFNLL